MTTATIALRAQARWGPRATRLAFQVHSWLGLVTGVFILLVSLTGSALVYGLELDRWWHREQLTVTPAGAPLPLDSLIGRLRERYPLAEGGAVLWFPRGPAESYGFRLYGTARPLNHFRGWDLYVVDMDPYTGRVLREGNHRDVSLPIQWVHTFHYSLHTGTWGIALLAVVAITLLLSLVSGIVVFRRHLVDALLFRVPLRGRGWRGVLSGLHRLVGVWALVLTALIFYSGLEMNWVALTPAGWAPLHAPVRETRTPASVDRMLAETRAHWPGFRVRYLLFPFTVGDSVRIAGDVPGTPTIIAPGASSMAFDALTGAGMAYDINLQPLATQAAASTYTFHVGTFLGEWSRAAYVVIGLLPGLLSVTGFLLWWRRTRGRGAASARRGRVRDPQALSPPPLAQPEA